MATGPERRRAAIIDRLGHSRPGVPERDNIVRAHALGARAATNRKAAVYSLVEELLEPLNHAERLALLDDVGPELHAALIQNRISTSARQRS